MGKRALLSAALVLAALALALFYAYSYAGNEERARAASAALHARFEQAVGKARATAQGALAQVKDQALQSALRQGLEDDLAWAKEKEEALFLQARQEKDARAVLVGQAGWLVAVTYLASAAGQAGVRTDIPAHPAAARQEALTRLATTRILAPAPGESLQHALAKTTLEEQEVRAAAARALRAYAGRLKKEAEEGTAPEKRDAAARRLLALLLVLETAGGTEKK